MVRVLSLHNFPRQEVMAVDEVVSAAVAPPHNLLLAQKNHTILVKNDANNASFSVPTVDQAVSVYHSVKGNYIASLESRGEVRFVRAYIGWEVAAGSGPLRARIAGRVTPLSQQSQGIEMLEVPTPGMPDCIGVCSSSGNMVVSCGSSISLFYFTIQTHEKSRVDFVDLLKAKWTLELAFTPTTIRICENVIAAFNDRYLHVVRIGSPPRTQEPASHCESTSYDDLIAAGVITTFEFPSVVAEPQIRQMPFFACPDLAANLSYDSPKAEVELKVPFEDLLMLQLTPCIVGSTSRREIADLFTCLVLQPYYHKVASIVKKSEPPILGSKLHQRLSAVACFFGTQQEGYLYHFIPSQQVEKTPISVYPFTAPLITAVLEDCLLHALTDAGLETYTLRVPTVAGSLDRLEEDPICLLGLRPFLHVRQLLLGDKNLFLIASEDSEPSTVYQLTLADPEMLWTDFLSAAKENQWEAPATYSHLVREAQHILKVRRERLDIIPEKFEALFRKACAVLADHYILYGEVEAASDLYRASRLKVTNVIKRIQQLIENVPEPHKSKFNPEELNLNLLLHLEHCLKIEDDRYRNHRGNKEDFYTPDIGSLLVSVLDTAEREAPSRLSQLILSSPLAQTFGSDRSHSTLSAINERTPADTFALALVSIQRGQQERGLALLQELEEASVEELILTYSGIFLQEGAFSEFGLILLQEFSQLLARVLSQLIKIGDMNLAVIQKILIGHLQPGGAYGKNAAGVLQTILENELARLLDEKKCIGSEAQEHAGTLTWLYLTQLKQRWEAHCEGDPLFKDSRPSYLDHIPPFGLDLNQILSPQASHAAPDSGEPKNVLLKLQCLLASDISRTSLYRVRVFLTKTPKVFGSMSIQVQCASPQEAAQLLLNFTPQALIPYLKDKSIHECDWRSVLNQVNNKITAATDPKRKFYYQQIEQGVLEHIAQNLTLKDVADLLPADMPARNVCLRVAHNNEQAAHIKALIMMTGAQLS